VTVATPAPSAIRHLALDSVGSTNAEALARARAGETGPLWITARTQTAGRGRRGRAWISVPGNLHATLLLTDPAPPGQAAQISFVAALAVYDAVAVAAPNLASQLALKWPNDLLCGGAKLAGILIEAESGERTVMAVGIGVNVTHHPDGTEYPATDLAAAGAMTTAEAVFAALTAALDRRLRQWYEAGFSAIRSDWLAHAAGRGGALVARLGSRELAGVFDTLDADGRLVLRLPDGTLETIAAGEVFPVGSAGSAGER
jgi:BirA family transcriptional regulator, biotin operon repressor / biotin---[acetyl-CoA-carboxylase] ligase